MQVEAPLRGPAMKLTYLGDAHDHWKGSVFQYLQEGEILRNFLVDSMATDASPWNTANSKLYAHLLRIEESQLVQHGRTLSQDRKARRQYFLNIPRTGDLFLDPDTGIKTSGSNNENYLLPQELCELMATEKDRLVIVYQHSARGSKMRERVKSVLAKLAEQKRSFSCSSYESNTVALLFFSMTAERTRSVRNCFARLTRGTDAADRIGHWNC
jgi:hypothetical protein